MFRVPTHVWFGTGSLDHLPEVVSELDASRVVVAHGSGIVKSPSPKRGGGWNDASKTAGSLMDQKIIDVPPVAEISEVALH